MKTPEELKVLHDQRQIGLAPDEICIREGIVLKINERARHGFEFFCFRSPECAVEMDSFIKYAKDKRKFIDIGASHGIFSMVFSKIHSSNIVKAFEPADEAFEILNYHVMNGNNIKPFKYALSDKKGTLTMRKEWDHFVSEGSNEGDAKVNCIIGDSFCANYIKPDIIKCDCEGHEVKVLCGLSNTIKENHPVIFLEVHPQRIINEGDTVEELLSMLQQWGYKAIDTRTNEPISFEEIAEAMNGELRLILIHG